MKHYTQEWIEEWCQANGWTDLVMERRNHYWAFPPGAVMPEPIPAHTLKLIKAEKGLTPEEKSWSVFAVSIAILATLCSYIFKCPLPLIFAFAFTAITVARLEVE